MTAWRVEHKLSIGQIKVEEKSNEITAIPADKLSGALALLSVSDNSSSPSILKNGAASVSPDIAGIADEIKAIPQLIDYQVHWRY